MGRIGARGMESPQLLLSSCAVTKIAADERGRGGLFRYLAFATVVHAGLFATISPAASHAAMSAGARVVVNALNVDIETLSDRRSPAGGGSPNRRVADSRDCRARVASGAAPVRGCRHQAGAFLADGAWGPCDFPRIKRDPMRTRLRPWPPRRLRTRGENAAWRPPPPHRQESAQGRAPDPAGRGPAGGLLQSEETLPLATEPAGR